ncbi:hypothetical protein BGZ73_009261, partial [Actinomortierella ambigua]
MRKYAESPPRTWDDLKESVRKVTSREIFTKGRSKEERIYGTISSSEDVGRKEICVYLGSQLVPPAEWAEFRSEAGSALERVEAQDDAVEQLTQLFQHWDLMAHGACSKEHRISVLRARLARCGNRKGKAVTGGFVRVARTASPPNQSVSQPSKDTSKVCYACKQ